MRIAAQQRGARFAEPLQMDLMTNAVARTRMINARPGSDGLKVQMIVMVFRSEARHIVVDVADRQIRLDRSCSHRFVEQERGGSRSILGECLVDANPNLLAGLQLALNEVSFKYLVNKCLSQSHTP